MSDIADDKEHEPLALKAIQLERVSKNLHVINEEMKLVQRDEGLSREEKRRRLDDLTIERNALIKETVIDVKP